LEGWVERQLADGELDGTPPIPLGIGWGASQGEVEVA